MVTPAMEWEVWCADGSRWNSAAHRWEDVPHGVLVLRYWNVPDLGGKGVAWGDAFYGRPDTLKREARVPDADFARVLAEAQRTTTPPSAR